jgi:hypothetical protein
MISADNPTVSLLASADTASEGIFCVLCLHECLTCTVQEFLILTS